MAYPGFVAQAADRILDKMAPKAVAKADRYECSWEYRCFGPPCGYRKAYYERQRRMVCAGHDGPSYGRWENLYCCG